MREAQHLYLSGLRGVFFIAKTTEYFNWTKKSVMLLETFEKKMQNKTNMQLRRIFPLGKKLGFKEKYCYFSRMFVTYGVVV